MCGAIVISLIFPFTITLLGYMKRKAKKRTIIAHVFILFYLFLELLLDCILKIPFREILTIHISYIIIFYVAMLSLLGVSFEKNRKMEFVVTLTFLILIGCLIFYLPFLFFSHHSLTIQNYSKNIKQKRKPLSCLYRAYLNKLG